jgi:hypothetical protein
MQKGIITPFALYLFPFSFESGHHSATPPFCAYLVISSRLPDECNVTCIVPLLDEMPRFPE